MRFMSVGAWIGGSMCVLNLSEWCAQLTGSVLFEQSTGGGVQEEGRAEAELAG